MNPISVMRISTAAYLGLTLMVVAGLQGQKAPAGASNTRPTLHSAADTNSAESYLVYGAGIAIGKPDVARASFYWASRLDPRSADALYSQTLTWFLEQPGRFRDYINGHKKLRESGEAARIDSLTYLALARDPSVIPRVQASILGGKLPLIYSRKPAQRAEQMLVQGRYAMALVEFGKALVKDSANVWLHIGRAHSFYLSAQYDSAALAFRRASELKAKRDDEKGAFVYESKALYEYSAGNAFVMAGNVAAAREAYGRAIAEDLSFFMAHVRLGDLAMIERDTATAISEYETALSLRGSDPIVRFDYGDVLASFGKREAAAEQYRKAIELEPLYAPAYLGLARVEDARGNAAATKEALRAFVALAPRDDPMLPRARARLAALEAAP